LSELDRHLPESQGSGFIEHPLGLKDMLSQKTLKELLYYNPETGIFRWKVRRGSRGKIGAIAGSIDSKGYRRTGISGYVYATHRLVWFYMNGEWPLDQIDHINGDKMDNRIINLRLVSNLENSKNQRLRSTNTSGFNGVVWHKAGRKWHTSIWVGGKNIYLGLFSKFDDAVAARRKANENHRFHPNHGQ